MSQTFGETNLEKQIKEKIVCREIVKTIRDFGVNQDQILHIIGLLALELDDQNHVVVISNAVRSILEDPEASSEGSDPLLVI